MIHCDTAGCRGFQPLPSWPYAWRYRDFPTSYCGNPAACIRAERRTLRQRLRTFRAAFSVFSTDTDRYASSKSLPHGNPTQPASLPFAFSSAYGCPLDRSFLTPNLRCAMIIVQHKPNFRSRSFFTEERSCIPSDRSQNSQVSPFRRFAPPFQPPFLRAKLRFAGRPHGRRPDPTRIIWPLCRRCVRFRRVRTKTFFPETAEK